VLVEEVVKMEHPREKDTSGADQTSPVPRETAEDSSLGELINERYSLLSRIADGPTGKLYRARDVKTESEVTLKLLAAPPGLDDSLIGQIREELSVTRALAPRRPNIALVYDCDLTADGRVVVVMEPLEGRSLLDLIQRRERQPVERALRLASHIAEGLHAAHDVGLVHGALSSEHVLVQGTDTVKVLGFEVARLRAAGRKSSPSDGAAPSGEANRFPLSGQAAVLTEAADIHSVGMVLAEILTGGVPHGPRGLGTLPAPVRDLVMKALVRTTGASSLDMGALAKALSTELSRRPEPSASRAWRRARPETPWAPWKFVGAGALTAVIGALTAWLTWSFVAVPRRPVTSEIPAAPTHQVVSDPASSRPGPVSSPRSSEDPMSPPLSPPSATVAGPRAPERPVAASEQPRGDAVPPRAARVKPPRPESPSVDTPPVGRLADGPTRPSEAARPALEDGSVRPGPSEPDPSAIIDWLIENKGLIERR
jgi:serine/threonine-protein kinase